MVVTKEYPVHLGVAYLFLVGYSVRTLFLSLRLPGAVGVIVSGFSFSFFMQEEILQGRDELQALSFFLVLLTAGMEISLGDLKPHIIVSAIVPATFELISIAAYAYFVMEWTAVESCVLGTVLFGLGDGLVIPKMSEFGQQFPGHHLPRLIFIWAPLEASYALMLFGVVSGVAEPLGEETASVKTLVLANVLRLLATLGVGAIAGAGAGWFISNRSRLPIPFSGTTVEGFLFLLATALAGFGLSSAENGPPLVPMGFAPGSLFQPELMVIVIGCLFARVADPEVLHATELTMGGVWVFGQLILFSMLGSRTDISVFAQVARVLPILVVGLSMRFLGILLVTMCTLCCRPCTCSACFKANKESAVSDAFFCFLATLPRATLQGALGQVPITERFFHRDPSRAHVQMFISVAARLYIVCMSVLGSILLDAIGPRILANSKLHTVRCIRNHKDEMEYAEHGWTVRERRRSSKKEQKVARLMNTMRRLSGDKTGPVPPDCAAAAAIAAMKKGKQVGFEQEPLMSKADTSGVCSTMPWAYEHSQRTSSSGRSRTSTWSTIHQLDSRLVEEPTTELYDDMAGELWECSSDFGDVEAEGSSLKDGFLPDTNIKGDPIEECDVPPL